MKTKPLYESGTLSLKRKKNSNFEHLEFEFKKILMSMECIIGLAKPKKFHFLELP